MRKLWFSIICALVVTGCDDDGFTTEKLDNFRDPRANYELQSVEFLTASITDAISLDVRGWEVENLSRKVTFTIDQITTNILWSFNARDLIHLGQLVPEVGDTISASIMGYQLMRITPDVIYVSTNQQVAHLEYSANIIESRKGISEYYLSEADTDIALVVYAEGVSLEIFGELYRAHYFEGSDSYQLRFESKEVDGKSQLEQVSIELNGDAVRLEKGSSTYDGWQNHDVISHRELFEYNRKQNTLSIQ
ncbi:hypothetical protein ACPV4A_10810 [Vibrio rotiferianus]|uniref:hypothetical protein n=1 Tax=Vibrio rotiferianus TaxID=190895 RepID=UPI00406A2F09